MKRIGLTYRKRVEYRGFRDIVWFDLNLDRLCREYVHRRAVNGRIACRQYRSIRIHVELFAPPVRDQSARTLHDGTSAAKS